MKTSSYLFLSKTVSFLSYRFILKLIGLLLFCGMLQACGEFGPLNSDGDTLASTTREPTAAEDGQTDEADPPRIQFGPEINAQLIAEIGQEATEKIGYETIIQLGTEVGLVNLVQRTAENDRRLGFRQTSFSSGIAMAYLPTWAINVWQLGGVETLTASAVDTGATALGTAIFGRRGAWPFGHRPSGLCRPGRLSDHYHFWIRYRAFDLLPKR